MSCNIEKIARPGYTEANMARLEQLMLSLRPVNLNMSKLSFAIASIIKSM